MANFVFAYHGGGKPDTPEEGEKLKGLWWQWIKDQGDAVVNPGTPVGMSKTVHADGVTDDGGPNPLMGFSVIAADDMDAALEIAKSCPHLMMEGASIEVAEAFDMSPPE